MACSGFERSRISVRLGVAPGAEAAISATGTELNNKSYALSRFFLATEFQKILDHKGLTVGDPVSAMARLQLGRSYVRAGDTAKAKAAYQQFLNLWKDADPGVPVLRQARAELAKL